MEGPSWFSIELMEEAHRLCDISYRTCAQQLEALRPQYQVTQALNGKVFFAMNDSIRWLVFRGTQDLQDIITNLRVSPMEISPLCEGAAHGGFVQRASLAPNIPHSEVRLVVTGHSLGGGAAEAWTIKRLLQRNGEQVVCLTFATPFLVDKVLQANLRHNGRTDAFVSLVNPGDPVPVLPRVVHDYMTPAGHFGILCGKRNIRWIMDPQEQLRAVQPSVRSLQEYLEAEEFQQLKFALDTARRYGPPVPVEVGPLKRLVKSLEWHSLSHYDHRSELPPPVMTMYGLPMRRVHVVIDLPEAAPASAAARGSEPAFEEESLSRNRRLLEKGAQALTQLSAIKTHLRQHCTPEMLGLEVVTDSLDQERKLFYSLENHHIIVETAIATTNDREMTAAPHAIRLRIRNCLPEAVLCGIPAGTVFEQPTWNKVQNVATQRAEVVHLPARCVTEVILPALCMNEQYDCPKHDNVNLTPFVVRDTGAVEDQAALWNYMAHVLGYRREQILEADYGHHRTGTDPPLQGLGLEADGHHRTGADPLLQGPGCMMA